VSAARGRTRAWPALAAILAAATPAAGAADDLGPLFLAGVAVEGKADLAAAGPVDVTIRLNPGGEAKAASLREWFPAARAEGGRVTVRLEGAAPRAGSAPVEAQRAATFLVDFDEPAVAALKPALLAQAGERPSDAGLADFVRGFVTTKSMRRMVDPASVVAARKEGDCTEHAVLLVALARLGGRPARMVFGVVLAPLPGGTVAAGHAWAELHDGTRWSTVDAVALPAGARYLPLSVVADEGPGHLLAAWSSLSPVDVRGLSLSAPGPAAAPPAAPQ
jgi:transglutaminase-like putative cysteine protease